MKGAHYNIWQNCLKIIKENISEEEFEYWFKPIKPYKYDPAENKLTIKVPSPFFYEYIETHYLDLIKKALTQVLGNNPKLEYAYKFNKKSSDKNTITLPEKSLEQNIELEQKLEFPYTSPMIYPGIQKYKVNSHLSKGLTFDNFVVGPCNEIAYTYATTVAENPGKAYYNPLLLFGLPGVGKTHLLHAIGNKLSENFQNLSILYIDAATFQQQFTNSIKNNEFNDFLTFYKNIDILLFDDIQELAGKEKTQKAFFTIFNFLQFHSKQIIITSDRYPSELEGFFDKLLSRFKSGTSVEIFPPNKETKFKILKSIAYREGINISDKILQYIAEESNNDVREVRGILFSLIALSVKNMQKITLDFVKDFIKKFVKKQQKDITLNKILKVVSSVTGITEKDIKSQKRQQEIVLARQLAMYFAKKLTSLSLKTIGKEIGNRDHATVLYSIRTVENLSQTDKSVMAYIEKINSLLNYDQNLKAS